MIADVLLTVFYLGCLLFVLPAVIGEIRAMHARGRERVGGRSWQNCCGYSAIDHADGLCERRDW